MLDLCLEDFPYCSNKAFYALGNYIPTRFTLLFIGIHRNWDVRHNIKQRESSYHLLSCHIPKQIITAVGHWIKSMNTHTHTNKGCDDKQRLDMKYIWIWALCPLLSNFRQITWSFTSQAPQPKIGMIKIPHRVTVRIAAIMWDKMKARARKKESHRVIINAACLPFANASLICVLLFINKSA